jgi:hypothetical protein
MGDRELLEAAAKAAGITVRCVGDGRLGGNVVFYAEPSQLYWNPLTDDGDALRLACALKLNIAQGDFSVGVDDEDEVDEAMFVPSDDKRCEVVRRAIVRAAAALGAA